MYLVSFYFDEKTNNTILSHMKHVASACSNFDMIENKVMPHITVAAFETKESEENLIKCLDKVFESCAQGKIKWVSAGAFFSGVLYLMPVLNEYMHEISVQIDEALLRCQDSRSQAFYRPFSWVAHTTIARKLTQEQMEAGFVQIQRNFVPFEGKIIAVGISKTSPKTEVKRWHFRDETQSC